MIAQRLVEKEEMIAYFRRDIGLHLYALGDLEEPYWSRSTFWGWREDERLQAIVLLYQGDEGSTVLALTHDAGPMHRLLEACKDELPRAFYGHLSPAAITALQATSWNLTPKAKLWKMLLAAPQTTRTLQTRAVYEHLNPAAITALQAFDAERRPSGVFGLESSIVCPTPEDGEAIEAFYEESYPGHWFTRGRLAEGWIRGFREGGSGRWLALAGVHVASPSVGVAALGNIAVHPSARGRGLGKLATARLCRDLQDAGIHDIGLNVDQTNLPALRCYEALGFQIVAPYEEAFVER